jgi:hypothetical protein
MNSHRGIRLAAWFQVAVGILVIAWWAIAASTSGIEEVNEGKTDIFFHIAAELSMAWLLILGGLALIRRGSTTVTATLAGFALGALVYSSINSPGYFAERGDWWAVGMFGAIGAAAILMAVGVARGGLRGPERVGAGHKPRIGVRSEAMIDQTNPLDRNRSTVSTP